MLHNTSTCTYRKVNERRRHFPNKAPPASPLKPAMLPGTHQSVLNMTMSLSVWEIREASRSFQVTITHSTVKLKLSQNKAMHIDLNVTQRHRFIIFDRVLLGSEMLNIKNNHFNSVAILPLSGQRARSTDLYKLMHCTLRPWNAASDSDVLRLPVYPSRL